MAGISEYVEFKKSPLPLEMMRRVGEGEAGAYRTAKPFPHIVVDDFFDPAILERILDEFPGKDDIDWKKFDGKYEVKLASKSERQLGFFTRYFLYSLNSSTFMNFLEELTGIEGLIPDPHLTGGGLHQILPGGKLGVHADFNRDERLKLDRRLNLLIYLNKDWKEEYGGHLELWSQDMKTCARRVLPVFNRIVLFSTTDFAYHGHPEPLACPEGRSRKSIAMYYYSNGRPAEEVKGDHTTRFQNRPTDKGGWREREGREFLKKFIPPIILDARKALRRKRARKDPSD